MEKQNTFFCKLLPHACSAGLPEPRSVNEPESIRAEQTPVLRDHPVREPWSVFEGVYWI